MGVIKAVLKSAIPVIFLFLVSLCIPRLAGFQVYAVTSGSMEPVLPVGSLIWIREKEDIQKGDIITFGLGESVVTHRVERVLAEEESYITKGDANENEDLKPVKKEQILGKVYFKIPWLGFAAMALGTMEGKVTAAALVLWILCLEVVAEDIQVMKKARRSEKRNGQKKVGSSSCSGSDLVCSRLYRGVYDGYSGETEKYDYSGKH